MKISNLLVSTAASAALLMCLSAARAQDRAYLPKAEVQALLSGKKVLIARAVDSAQIEWDVNKNGKLRAFNRSAKNRISGDWKARDDGAFCVRWAGAAKPDCNFYFNDGGTYKATETKAADAKPAFVVRTIEPLK